MQPLLIFDFVNEQGRPERRVFRNPVHTYTAYSINDVYPMLEAIQDTTNKGYFAAGYISYEAAPAFDPEFKVHHEPRIPLLWFGIFDAPHTMSADIPVEYRSNMSWTSDTTPAKYARDIRFIKDAIAAGQTYQVNYTMRLRTPFSGDDLKYYHHLKRTQQTPYSAYLNTGRYRILSMSPELFFSIRGDTVTTRPMKGTSARGRWLEEDQTTRSRLMNSTKDQAENVMIVDLLRNDLSKLAGVTSVRVPRLFDIESYTTVHQMTSTVSATLNHDTTFIDVLRALFPCGSVTGAPKISTMRIIAELEQSPREIYCGTIGMIDPDGAATFNVAIRTVLIDAESKVAEYGVGGGITWDSTSSGEYEEAWSKATALTTPPPPFALLETLRLDPSGQFALLDRHVNRLSTSATYFDIEIDLDTIIESLQDHASQFLGSARRVRLLVSQTGKLQIESTPLSELSSSPKSVVWANSPISKTNRFLYHKTTHREVYERHQREHPEAFDVLLWNDDGQITEFTNGNIVLELDGKMLTPARHCGLLAGTFRSQLLDDGVIEETILTRADVERATRMWLINSVRGFVPVELSE